MAKHALGGASYILAFIALLILTALSWGAAHITLGPFGPFVAFGVATLKAGIVILIFMHLYEATFASQMVVITLILFIALICLGIVSDVAYR